MNPTDSATSPDDPAPGPSTPTEVPQGEPIGIPQSGPDVIDPGIGIPTGPSPIPLQPGTPGAPTSPGVSGGFGPL